MFWLHDASIDRLYADSEAAYASSGGDPRNTGEMLQPVPITTRTVGQVLDIRAPAYVYA